MNDPAPMRCQTQLQLEQTRGLLEGVPDLRAAFTAIGVLNHLGMLCTTTEVCTIPAVRIIVRRILASQESNTDDTAIPTP